MLLVPDVVRGAVETLVQHEPVERGQPAAVDGAQKHLVAVDRSLLPFEAEKFSGRERAVGHAGVDAPLLVRLAAVDAGGGGGRDGRSDRGGQHGGGDELQDHDFISIKAMPTIRYRADGSGPQRPSSRMTNL